MPGGEHASKTSLPDAFWTRLVSQLERAGFRSRQRGSNFCRLPLPGIPARLVLVAPTGDGGLSCKLDLLSRRGSLDPAELLQRLAAHREEIEAELALGRLEWGGRSPRRIYLFADFDLGDPTAYDAAIDWLVGAATRFKAVFEPRLANLGATVGAHQRTRLSGTSTRSGQSKPRARRAHRPAAPQRVDSSTGSREPVASGGRHVKPSKDVSIEETFRRLGRQLDLVVEPLRVNKPLHGFAWGLHSADFRNGKGTYRYAYALWWDTRAIPTLGRSAAWILLNPLGAESSVPRPRPTLGYCRNRSMEWGYGGLVIVNLFAYRADSPAQLATLDRDEAIGPVNDTVLQVIASQSAVIVGAWGYHGSIGGRSDEVRQRIQGLHFVIDEGGRGFTASGEPSHPRMLPKAGQPRPMHPSPFSR
jgi:hypothetical protein